MCCCKWCQYYLESIYWHCIEKHFCFDENIVLYEEEDPSKSNDSNSETNIPFNHVSSNGGSTCKTSNNNIYDNMAFYDNVAMIANRSIFIIEPKETRKPSLDPYAQPRPKSLDWDRSLHKEIFFTNDAKVITEQPKAHFSIAGSTSSLDLSKSEPDLAPETPKTPAQREAETFRNIPIPLIRTNTISLSSLATINEDEINHQLLTLPHSATSTGIVKMRKKSLIERRVSKSLTLDIDPKRQDMPIIRQSSFPKFYIDTPEANQNTSSIGTNAIQALETPVKPNTFNFDLKTVVQLETERQELETQRRQLRRSATSAKDNRRIQQIRDKLKPIKLLRNASMQSLYSNNQ